eukprot:CAMPEP_0171154066 /NCGR_PEP_ID=MMETSP0790-20130122/89_1 /TAXON_ID=2925 /ORGANISM="Alexandrium catenella, Strain OF101" /LENGTH=89 /DNA_ID=CAMNT_0011618035 /DNA_START=99 /DNA_END=364 /DNA_ORIENTATION=-
MSRALHKRHQGKAEKEPPVQQLYSKTWTDRNTIPTPSVLGVKNASENKLGSSGRNETTALSNTSHTRLRVRETPPWGGRPAQDDDHTDT